MRNGMFAPLAACVAATVLCACTSMEAARTGTIRLEGGAGRKAESVFTRRLRDDRARGEVYDEAVNAFRTHYDDVHPHVTDWTKGLGLWQGEYWGKCMLSHVAYARMSGDAEEKDFIRKKAVEFVRTFQREDGYLCSYANEDFICDCCWNIWSRKYTMWALIEAYDLTGERELLESAAKMADHLVAQLKRLDIPIGRTGCFVGMPSMSILKPMLLLYERTLEPRYLEFARCIVEENDRADGRAPNLIANAFGDKPVHEWYPEPQKWAKAYEMMSDVEGFVEYYLVTGERRPLEAAKRLWEKLYANELNDLFGAGFHDHFVNAESRPNVITEVCDTIHWMRLCHYLNEATGDVKYLDAWELAYFNAFLGGVNRDGFWGPHDVRGHGTRHLQMPGEVGMKYHLCCIANVPRAFGDWGERQIVQRRGGLDINFYTDCEWSGDGVAVKMSGDYPVGDRVTVRVSSSKPMELRFRIPGWCPKVTLNDSLDIGGGVRRKGAVWRSRFSFPVEAGEREIAISFEMPVGIRRIHGKPTDDSLNAEWFEMTHINKEMAGYARKNFGARVMRGPLVLAKSRNSGCDRDTVFGEIEGLDSSWNAKLVPEKASETWGAWTLELSKGDRKHTLKVCDFESAADFDDAANFFSIRF